MVRERPIRRVKQARNRCAQALSEVLVRVRYPVVVDLEAYAWLLTDSEWLYW